MSKLLLLISIPHGGTFIPAELRSAIRLSTDELLADGDPFTGQIYDVGDLVNFQIEFDIARAIVDVNRAPDDLPSGNPDGVVKTVSIFNNPVYAAGKELTTERIAWLLDSYFHPYHSAIEEALRSRDVLFGFDCHSMERIGPPIAKDTGRKRPLFCLGNVMGEACSEELTRKFANCLCRGFSLPAWEVAINRSFGGGYITRKYGRNPVAWIQIEMSRALYLEERRRVVRQERIRELNACFR